MGFGKRAKRRELKAWLQVYLHHPTNPGNCDCGHGGLEGSWHSRTCPVSLAIWSLHP